MEPGPSWPVQGLLIGRLHPQQQSGRTVEALLHRHDLLTGPCAAHPAQMETRRLKSQLPRYE